MADNLFGGIAEGITQGRQQQIQQQQVDQQGNYATQRLQIEQQRMDNENQRALFARADKDVANLMDTATTTIQHLKLSGKDNAEISKAIQPLIQSAKKLKESAGGDPSSIDAQIATTLAEPSYNPPGAAVNPAASPSDIPAQPSGTGPRPPGQNITDQNVVKVEQGPTTYTDSRGNVVPGPQQSQQPQQPSQVDYWTNKMLTLPSYAPPSMREAIKTRLDAAVKAETPDAAVHFLNNDDGSAVPLIVRKQGGNVSISDMQGNPYVPATGSTKAQDIADAIMEGKQPPNTTGLYKQAAGVRSYLAKQGFDMTQANLEWQAAQQQVKTINGPQAVRYVGLANSVVNTIDRVKDLSTQMQQSGIPALNALKLRSYVQSQGNSEKGQLASQYLAAVGTLKEEFANLANGGYAPTEAAWALANSQINADYGVKQMDATLTEVQRLIRYRLNAMPKLSTLGPDAQNRYAPPAAPAEGGSATPAGGPPKPPPGFVVLGQ